MTAMQMSLLDLMRGPPIKRPVDPDGHVVQGRPLETLILPHPRMAWDLARIELHPHDGLWMWSASTAGGSYKVGPKWGRFAASRDDAAHHAAQEILALTARVQDSTGWGITKAQLAEIRAWAEAISEEPAAQIAAQEPPQVVARRSADQKGG